MMEIYKKLNNLKVGSILDLATGRGGFLDHICPLFKDYEKALGIDLNQKALDMAGKEERDSRISFIPMDCESLDFDDGSFDVVSISNSLHHFRNRDLVLSEALRVLKPEGLLIISEMFHSADERPSQRIHTGFHHWWGEIDSALGTYHERTMTRDELLSFLHTLPVSSFEFEQFDGDDEKIHDEETVRQISGAFEMYKERAEKLEHSEALIEKGEALLEKLNRDGFAPASRLEIICTK
ncbi:class I SAM-dependent methyltransferase [Spirochaeta isovalerica]|uniref:Ubiquinone/menaquinone biosynthesis C-methylase UbiE n=1 Tax=Spirochaeta isovalerica TaxID=150 RepID=A0A841RGV8_9SPIO|nr:class I SAM-dependent methyltransferase [Spirochaeta isovalerica]MBB6482019.1 ubiquinone/menaquinone biosynthesis C-methylase UbiE [Spirochaeta isovalerica]